MRIQITAIRAPASALEAEQSRRASRFRVIAYSTAVLPFLLMVALAWLVPGFNRTEIPDWKPVLVLADASWEKGDLHEARHLYLQVDQIASWRQDWQGLVAAACGMKKLDGAEGPYSKTFAILIRATMAAEYRQSRQGIATVSKAFAIIGADKAGTAALARIQPKWPAEKHDSDNVQLLGACLARAKDRAVNYRKADLCRSH